MVSNTLFKLPKRWLYTWKAPGDYKGRIIGYKIDYVLVNTRFQNSIKAVKTYPGVDIGSDHNPLEMDIFIRLKKRQYIIV